MAGLNYLLVPIGKKINSRRKGDLDFAEVYSLFARDRNRRILYKSDRCFYYFISLFLAASRLILAALILLPTWRNFSQTQVARKFSNYAIAAGICLALLHF
ncbi:hypothetical protein IQ238_19080 [Pleurocapsales cyanobacterium LEGE 06147]|nr:hypothetical protein [Pleurocapsales cyanobacterium LEGE 06147]